MTVAVPVISDVTYQDLVVDPYPVFKRIRDTGPAVFLSAANLTLVTRFEDITEVERDAETYSSYNPASLVHNVMGPTFMRRDGADHQAGRRSLDPSFRPAAIKEHWTPKFDAIAGRLLDALAPTGEADLFPALAAPVASLSLMELIGFRDVAWETLAHWSQALIDGVGNYSRDGEIERIALEAGKSVDEAIDAVLDYHRANPSPAILSSMLHTDPPMPIEEIRGNIKVIIGGGLNEPRDALLTLILGLVQNPEQKERVQASPEHWPLAFDEAVRWISPIGVYPRRVARPAVLSGVALPEGAQLGLCAGAANRDDRRFDNPDSYDVFRAKKSHLAFGSGPHFCLGSWVARQNIGRIVAPKVFERLRNLRLREEAPPVVRGFAFRGPVSLPVRWDP